MVKQQPHHNVGTCLWHVSPQTAMPPTQSVRFPTHKKISEIREICVSQRNTKPHSIREISHPQKKSVRSVRSV